MKKGNTVERTLLYYKKKYLKLLVYIQLACVCKRWLWPVGEELEDHCRMR